MCHRGALVADASQSRSLSCRFNRGSNAPQGFESLSSRSGRQSASSMQDGWPSVVRPGVSGQDKEADAGLAYKLTHAPSLRPERSAASMNRSPRAPSAAFGSRSAEGCG